VHTQAGGAAFDKWYVMYVDERNVPHDHPDSTHKAVQEALLSKIAIPPENVISIVENAPVDQASRNMPCPQPLLRLGHCHQREPDNISMTVPVLQSTLSLA